MTAFAGAAGTLTLRRNVETLSARSRNPRSDAGHLVLRFKPNIDKILIEIVAWSY